MTPEGNPGRSKARLTITLAPDVLDRVDRLIDEGELSNRSQAIEALLRRSLKPSVTTAVILAGGDHDGPEIPALVPIGGQALVARTILHLAGFGIRSFVVLAGPYERAIKRLMGDGRSLDVQISYLRERSRRGTAGALKLVQDYVGDDPFLVIHGDVLTDIDIADFIAFHLNENTMATIAVKPRQSEKRYGQVLLQGNRITNFLESGRDAGISIVNTGVYLFGPAVFGMIDKDKTSQLEEDVFPRLARMGELSAFLFQGIWYDISSPKNYRKAKMRWSEKGAGAA
ncbi:MAG: ribbon-helix-helix protein, CopG family [bacterium]|nr:ribbon-helix-helix protein, CopG family [bacterium]